MALPTPDGARTSRGSRRKIFRSYLKIAVPEHLDRERQVAIMAKKKQSSKNHNPSKVKARILALQKGFAGRQPTEVFDVAGTPVQAGQATTDLGNDIAPYTATDVAHESYEKTKRTRDAALPATLEHLDALEAAVVARLGSTNPDLADFGMTPRGTPHRTAAEKAQAAEKAAETRKEEKAPEAPVTPSTPPPGKTV
jgi:hypothetical protein